MAIVGKFPKQPSERIPFTISYLAVLAGRTATSITVVATSTPVGLTVDPKTPSDQDVQVFVSAGLDGVQHVVTVVATLVIAGENVIVEDEVRVNVAEVS